MNKKTIHLLVYFLIILNISFGQVPNQGDYITNSNIDKFEGTWKWTLGNDEVIIKLKKVKFLNSSPAYYDDVLLGCHTYIKNGIVVESSMGDFDLLGPGRKGTIYLWNIPEESSTKVIGSLKDISKDKDGKLTFEYINGSSPQIQWTLNTYEGLVIQPIPAGLTLPQSIILIKQ